MMKKTISLLTSILITLSIFVVLPFSVSAEENTKSGTTGDCTWKIDDRVLTISGNGEMGEGIDETPNRISWVIDIVGSVKWQPWYCGNIDYSNKINEVRILNGVTNIAPFAFFDSPNLNNLTISNSVKSIGKASFYKCKKLSNVVIPNSVTSIATGAFYGCHDMTSVTIGDSVKTIGGSAFMETSLNSVTIPASVTDIYEKAFGYYYDDNFGLSKKEGFTIYGHTGSEAQRYAKANGFSFKMIKSDKANKSVNPIKVTAKKTVKAKAKKKTTIKKAITVKNAQGKVTYKTNNKKVTVKKGNLIVAKGFKKGKTIKVKITITAKGNSNYKSKKIVKTVSIKFK